MARRRFSRAHRNPVRKEGSKWAVCKPDGSIDLLLGDEQAARRLAVACGYDGAPAAPTRRKSAAPKKKRPAAPAPSKHAQYGFGAGMTPADARRNPRSMLTPDLRKVALTYLDQARRALKSGDEAGASHAAGKAARLLRHYTGSDDKPSGY